MKLKIIFLSCILFLACTSSPEIKEISVEELKERLDKDSEIQLLDVRTSLEQKDGVIGNPIKINIMNFGFDKKAESNLDKNKEVYIYCRSGGRSLKAAKILLEKGYKPINIKGGYNSWNAKIKKLK